MTRDELISALEKSTGPDSKLDFEIVKALVRSGIISSSPLEGIHSAPLRFTSSRDAMIPGAELFDWTIHGTGVPQQEPRWTANAFSEAGGVITGQGHTEPIARRIAELKLLVQP